MLMHVLILGTRGVPARHGGFETFAQDLALYLVDRGHEVTVFCQVEAGQPAATDFWNGVQRILVPAGDGAAGTIAFDWGGVNHLRRQRQKGVVLTLGYNTAIFSLLYRLRGIPNIMNMDGIEWKREKWSKSQRAWLWLNELCGAKFSDHLIADHPEISRHLQRHTPSSKITTIPYGADALFSAPTEDLGRWGLSPKGYYLLIARPEPENSILEVVSAYSRKRRGLPLVVLGSYQPDLKPYHAEVLKVAREEVKFIGAIYDKSAVQSLRFHARAYIHGHRVGGTNPSLVESLAAGNAVVAHDNPFTRWVGGPGALYFKDADSAAHLFDLLAAKPELLPPMEAASRLRHEQEFRQEKVLGAYEKLLLRYAPLPAKSASECSPALLEES
jgi:glycosyltransferase involved in cell wall biosynthesis